MTLGAVSACVDCCHRSTVVLADADLALAVAQVLEDEQRGVVGCAMICVQYSWLVGILADLQRGRVQYVVVDREGTCVDCASSAARGGNCGDVPAKEDVGCEGVELEGVVQLDGKSKSGELLAAGGSSATEGA